MTYFIEVVSCKSINKAAKNLYITQPALTVALNALEDEVGVKLLIRSHSGVEPTEEGSAIYDDALLIINTIKKWEKYSDQNRTNNYVKVQLVSVPIIYSSIIHNIVVDISDAHPHLDVYPSEIQMNEILRAVREIKEPVVGLGYIEKNKFDELREAERKLGVEIEFLFSDEFRVFINAKNPLARKDYLDKNDLKYLTLAGYIEERPIDRVVKPLFNQNRYYRLYNQETILQMVIKNRAVAIFPNLLLQEKYVAASRGLKALPIKDVSFALNYILIHKTKKLTEEELLVIKQIKKYCTQFNRE